MRRAKANNKESSFKAKLSGWFYEVINGYEVMNVG